MRLLPTKWTVGTAATLALTGAFAPVAFADSNTTPSSTAISSGSSTVLASIKTRAATAISTRDSALQGALTAVNSNHYLASADRSAIVSTINGDLTGLNALAPVIQADTTVSQARADYDSIFTSYRVFALVLPQARLAAAADDITGSVLPRLEDAQSRLESLLAGADQSKDTAAVQAAMADLQKQLSGMASNTSGVSATVLGYKPADWNSNHAVLAPARADLVSARGDAKQARADIETVIGAIK